MTTQQLRIVGGANTADATARSVIDDEARKGRGLSSLLSIPGFQRLCASNAVTQSFGQRIQGIAVAWLVLEMTGSKFWLGVINGLPTVSIVLFSLIGGVLADSLNGRRILFLSRAALALTSIIAATLVSTGNVELSHLLLYVLVVVGIAAIDMPVSRTLVLKLVGSPRLLAASATQSILTNVVNILAPVSVGLLIGIAGPGGAFWLLGGGYALAAAMIASGPVETEAVTPRQSSPLTDVIEGIRYIRRTPEVAALLGLGFLVPVAGVYFAMVPVFAREVLRVGPGALGILVASFSAGSLLGSIYLAVNLSPRRRGLRLTQLGVLFGAGMMAFAMSQSFLLSCAISFLLGATAGLWQNMLSAMVQTVAVPEMRGRVVSVFTMAFQLLGIGWLAAGTLGTLAGNKSTLLAAGLVFALLSLAVFAWSRETREID